MNYQIENDWIKVTISSTGGEILSLKDNEGTEYIWEGDADFWEEHAPNLFPYIARLTEGRYRYRGKIYSMGLHGFVKGMELRVIFQKTDEIIFRLESSEATKTSYPFAFTYDVGYRLDENKIAVAYTVTNLDGKKMYFGIGGHPGIRVPLEKGLVFEDYYLKFPEISEPIKIEMSDNCFVTGKERKYPLKDGQSIELHHDLFDYDAIILRDMPKEVTLKSDKGRKGVTVIFPDMNYLGLWHTPMTKAEFVCIEPWSSLPSRVNRIEDLEQQENLIGLEAGASYQNLWSIILA